MGMKITGVDIIYNKFTKKAYVLELNNQPGIDIHHFPAIGRPQNVAKDIIDYILDQQTSNFQNTTVLDNPEIEPINKVHLLA